MKRRDKRGAQSVALRPSAGDHFLLSIILLLDRAGVKAPVLNKGVRIGLYLSEMHRAERSPITDVWLTAVYTLQHVSLDTFGH